MSSWERVYRFWFETMGRRQWFAKDSVLDARIAERFGSLLERASVCELFEWRQSPRGRLAEILVLDQFSRNIHRDSGRAFAQDPLALALAQEAVALGADRDLPAVERGFLYMPYMHSESAAIHREALKLFAQPGLEESLKFEKRHWAIIERFGRYPHRNRALGRVSTPEEEAFLAEPGSSF